MIRLFAYVDPGTGSFALQAIIGTVMGVSYAARNRIKILVGKFGKRTPQTADKSEKS
jgi:hypothetical protein